MTQPRKKLLAIILALVLSLTGLAALAEAPAEALYTQTDVMLDIDKTAVAQILRQVQLTDDAGQDTMLFDDDALEGIDLLLNAINNMWLSAISGPGLNTLTLRTEEDVLVDVQLVDDAEGDLATVTTSLLPGVGIRVPKDTMKEFIEVLPTSDAFAPEPDIGKAYSDAIEAYFISSVPSLEAAVAGSYDIENAGVFTKRTSYEVDSHMLLCLGTALLEVFKQDEAAKEAINYLLTSMATPGQPTDDAPPVPRNVQELIAALEQGIADGAREENRKVGTQRIYETEDGLRTYVETVLDNQEAAEPRINIAVLNEDGENGKDRLNRITIILDNPEGDTRSQAEPDWNALRHAIIDGSNKEDSFMTIISQTAVFETEQKMLHNAVISLRDHQGAYELISGSVIDLANGSKEGSTGLYLLTDEPLVTIHFAKKPLADGEVPALPAVEGRTDIYFGDGVDAQEEKDLSNILTCPPILVPVRELVEI